MSPLRRANLIALLVPAALMAGALGSQYFGHLYPCEMCWWQRWPHYSAIALALLALVAPRNLTGRLLIAGAAGGILTSGLIGIYHAGVEYHFWEGLTHCTSMASGDGDTLAQIMAAPLIRCDTPQWTLLGISLAGFNALISVPTALYVFNLLRKVKP